MESMANAVTLIIAHQQEIVPPELSQVVELTWTQTASIHPLQGRKLQLNILSCIPVSNPSDVPGPLSCGSSLPRSRTAYVMVSHYHELGDPARFRARYPPVQGPSL